MYPDESILGKMAHPPWKMLWGAISRDGVELFEWCDFAEFYQKKNLPRRGFTSLFYVEFILAAWEKHWRRHLRYRKTVFMEDNAPVHKTKEVRRTFAKFHQMNMRLSGLSLTLSDGSTVTLHWPPNSPDLNPIENLWRLVKHEVRRNNVTSLKKTQEAAT
eukprot:PhM_4_TR461/c3_g3_i6/m.80150